MNEWMEYKIGDVLLLEYGKGLKGYRDGIGQYEVFGTNGKIGFSDKFLYDQPSIIIGRKGAYRGVHLASKPFFVIDTAFYTKNRREDIDTFFLYYWLKNVDINNMDSGSAIPSTSRDEVYDLDIMLPSLPEQKAITAVLASLDDKIDLLHRQNQTLESIAQTLFRHWFIDGADDDWEKVMLQDICNIRRGSSPRPIQKYVENGTVPWIKIADATGSSSLEINETKEFIIKAGVSKSVEVFPGDLILSNSATAGLPFFVGLYGCIHDGWLLFRDFTVPKNFIYFLLHFATAELNQMADGTVQKNLNTTLLKEYPFKLPPSDLLSEFDEQAELFIEKIKANNTQIQTLESLRDTLLPKLMSGEVQVQNDKEATV